MIDGEIKIAFQIYKHEKEVWEWFLDTFIHHPD